jgi:hypothetical protein
MPHGVAIVLNVEVLVLLSCPRIEACAAYRMGIKVAIPDGTW